MLLYKTTMKGSQRCLLTCFVITCNLATAETCTTNEFQCTSGLCIPSALRCDGSSIDCDDQSDELNCPSVVQPCPEGRYRCGTGECVTIRSECPALTTMIDLLTSIVESSTQNIKETIPTNTNQKQSSTSYSASKIDHQPKATHSMPDDSSTIDTTPSVKAVTTPTGNQDPESENNNLLYLLLLLLLVPICLFAYYLWNRMRTSENKFV